MNVHHGKNSEAISKKARRKVEANRLKRAAAAADGRPKKPITKPGWRDRYTVSHAHI